MKALLGVKGKRLMYSQELTTERARFEVEELPTKRKTQHEKFVELARESDADENEDSFVTKIRAISSTKPKKKRTPNDR
jgi:hypothetical protein